MLKKTAFTIMLSLTAVHAVANNFPTTIETAAFGQGQTVTLEKHTLFDLVGTPIKAGDQMPSVNLLTSSLKQFDTTEQTGSIRVYSVLASVDTPVCVQQAIELSNYINTHSKELAGIDFYAVSSDTPFAQQRFINQHDLDSVTYLSDSVKHEFGYETGSQIEQLGLLTRSIIVTDRNNKIIFIQRVPELTTIPDLIKAVEIAKASV
ncbi:MULTISPECIES: peroxiredoxin [unclassified Vibrio]|uniref:peroxiredoxin n=1 Tax=unclassified Vibrio TaxID=2614977 RepID=UPI000C816674|nr:MULTISPECIES: peroxiredoxin [unclassified Vibrio]PMJ02056.1 thioredoxin peroxidase [Vibrio sp. 10N.286.45.E10]PTQ23670.1 thioredoxin peroxidase [Vibrio sp. 10N.286.46.E10]